MAGRKQSRTRFTRFTASPNVTKAWKIKGNKPHNSYHDAQMKYINHSGSFIIPEHHVPILAADNNKKNTRVMIRNIPNNFRRGDLLGFLDFYCMRHQLKYDFFYLPMDFMVKLNSDGTISRYKARLVAQGFKQQYGVDFTETFSPVVKPATIRSVLTIAHSESWSHRHLNVKNAFINGSSPSLLDSFIAQVNAEFCLTDLGELKFFLGVEVQCNSSGLFLSQGKYIRELLTKHGMLTCSSVETPMVSKIISTDSAALLSDPHSYICLVGALQYISFTRPDITYAVNQASQAMHCPSVAHMTAATRILRYLAGSISLGLQLSACSQLSLTAYSDSDWAGCPTTRKSTSRFCVFLGPNLVSWSLKKQPTVARSSTEAEYRALASTVAEVTWLQYLLRDLRVHLD
ncbi:transmembrane signal receptor [Lithospermum erythrorhizon]|uniref:Transmembrane signal receptor n=1 Tax=Lithospermum erythrorhizon TaxID=34254 RepID=A0AAV3PNN1_LITER